jgi:uncharacterized protein
MIFIDTGAFIARFIANDQYHQKALKLWEKISKSRRQCFTTNFVVDETLTLLGRRTSYSFAAEKANIIYESKVISILRPSAEDELKAVAFLEKFADQKVSFTDCISFVLMKNNKLKKAFSFDKHFQAAGFELLEGR